MPFTGSMASGTLTCQNIRDEVATQLGDSHVNVELAEKDFFKALKDAIRLYNHWTPNRAHAAIPRDAGVVTDEAVVTATGATISGTLGTGGTVNSGTVVFTLPITGASSPATIVDNGNGSLTGQAADDSSLTVVASSIDYATKAWSITLGGGVAFTDAGGTVSYQTQASSGRHEIDHPGLHGILSVSFISRDQFLGNPDAFEASLFGNRQGVRITGDTFGEYDQQRQYVEHTRRVSSAEPEWHATRERDGRYYLYLDISTSVSHISYEYAWHVTPDDNANTGIAWLNPASRDWIIDYVTARAKQILGRILRKFQGIPTPDGGVNQLDGMELMSEGKEEEERLKEEIRRRTPPLVPEIE